MQNGEGLTAEQIKEFLKGSEGVNFAGQNKREVYGWIEGVLVAQEFMHQDMSYCRIRCALAPGTSISCA